MSSPVWRRRRRLTRVRMGTRQVRRGLATLQHHQHQLDPHLIRYVLGLGHALEEFDRTRPRKAGGKR